jgi:phosphoserine aminotransferase
MHDVPSVLRKHRYSIPATHVATTTCRPITPTMLDYKTHADNDSMYNTPPCWTIYMCGLVFDKLLREGGLAAVQQRNQAKAKVLYDAIAGETSRSPLCVCCASCLCKHVHLTV